jgi:hypothetical protein
MKRLFAALIAIFTWVGLAMQFAFAIVNPATQDVAVAERIIRYFSFFTVVANGIIAIISTSIAIAPNSRPAQRLQTGSVLTAAAVYISIVAVVYSLFLRSVVNAQGWHLISDHIVHDVVPVLFVLFWLIYAAKDDIKWIDPVKWLVVPFLYIAYSLVHGALDNWYPYWFADVTKLGYPTALKNSAYVLVAFLIFGFIFVAIARLIASARKGSESYSLANHNSQI